jgi:hypothetical protein
MKQEEQKLEALRQALTITTRKQRLQKAKDLIKQFAKPRGSVVDSLILERHEDAKRE